MFFFQNDVLMGKSFWQKDSFVTLLLFDLCLSKHFSLSQIFVITLSLKMISRVFSYKCRLIHNFHFWSLRGLYFENLSYLCQHKYDLTISRTFGSHFWRILTFGPTVCPSPAQYSSSRPRAAPAIVSSIKRLGSLQQGLEGRYHDISSETAEQARHAAQRARIQNSVHKIQKCLKSI